MADIVPFRALRYDPLQVSPDLVVTQPYDKITPAMQDGYYAASPYNLVRIIMGKRLDSDNTEHNAYSRAAAAFREWRRQGILLQDSSPSIYLYKQRFPAPAGMRLSPGAKEYERSGFIALGRLEDYSGGVVHRHEQTLAKPKADRLSLLRATRAHFGQLFMLYQDTGEIEALEAARGQPNSDVLIEVTDQYGVAHRIGRVSDPAVIHSVRESMRDKKMIIADGHHRYETALAYRDEQRAIEETRGDSAQPILREAPYEYAMMTFVNMNSPGLVILPTHRVVHGLSSLSADDFRNSSASFFTVEDVDASMDAARATVILREAGRAGTALLAVTADRVLLLHRPKAAGNDIFGSLSLRQQSLDVIQLHKCVLEL